MRVVVDAELWEEWERNEFVLRYAGRHQHWKEVAWEFTQPNLLPQILCETCNSGRETEAELRVGHFTC